MDTEIWLSIPGYNGFYEASSLGRIRSVERTVKHWTGSPMKRRGRILSTTTRSNPYEFVKLSKFGEHPTRVVHHVIAETFLGPRPKGAHINHKDANKLNNSVDNLEYVTPKENVHHAMKLGLHRGPPGKPVVRIEDGKKFRNATAALKSMGFCIKATSAMAVAIRNGRTCGGFHFKYLEDKNDNV